MEKVKQKAKKSAISGSSLIQAGTQVYFNIYTCNDYYSLPIRIIFVMIEIDELFCSLQLRFEFVSIFAIDFIISEIISSSLLSSSSS